VIKAFLGAIAMLLVAGGGAAGPAIRVRSGAALPGAAGTSGIPARNAEGTNSTPGVFALPQIGSAGFTCNRGWEVQPFFDLGPAIATEAVTIRQGTEARDDLRGAAASPPPLTA
jgi:hypothetical protein